MRRASAQRHNSYFCSSKSAVKQVNGVPAPPQKQDQARRRGGVQRVCVCVCVAVEQREQTRGAVGAIGAVGAVVEETRSEPCVRIFCTFVPVNHANCTLVPAKQANCPPVPVVKQSQKLSTPEQLSYRRVFFKTKKMLQHHCTSSKAKEKLSTPAPPQTPQQDQPSAQTSPD